MKPINGYGDIIEIDTKNYSDIKNWIRNRDRCIAKIIYPARLPDWDFLFKSRILLLQHRLTNSRMYRYRHKL